MTAQISSSTKRFITQLPFRGRTHYLRQLSAGWGHRRPNFCQRVTLRSRPRIRLSGTVRMPPNCSRWPQRGGRASARWPGHDVDRPRTHRRPREVIFAVIVSYIITVDAALCRGANLVPWVIFNDAHGPSLGGQPETLSPPASLCYVHWQDCRRQSRRPLVHWQGH